MFEKGINKATNKNFSLGRLKTLIEVKNAGYISKAANQNTTTAALYSRQIGELESFFGKVSLKAKNGKLKGLSPEGIELAEIAETFLNSMQNFQDKVDGIVPSITIGSGETFLSSVLLPCFSKLKEYSINSRISLCNMRSSELPNALDKGDVDLIIVSEKRLGKNDQRKVLCKLDYKLYVPYKLEGHAKFKNSRLDMVCHYPFAALSGKGERKTFVEDLLKKEGKEPNYELECSSHIEMLEAVRSGCFCAILPSFLGDDLNLAHYARYNIPSLKDMQAKLCIAWRKETCHFKPEISFLSKQIQETVKDFFKTK